MAEISRDQPYSGDAPRARLLAAALDAHSNSLRYFGREFRALSRASGKDACGTQQKDLEKAQKELSQLKSKQATLYDREAFYGERCNKYNERAREARTPRERDEWEAKADEAGQEAGSAHQRAKAMDDDIADAQGRLEGATQTLRDCRDKNPAKGGCGSRGGPGVRRPDGKCAGWDDWEDSHGGYY